MAETGVVAPSAFQATITLDGKVKLSGAWLDDRQRCDDALLEIWMAVRKYHHMLTQGPQLTVPTPDVQKKLLVGAG